MKKREETRKRKKPENSLEREKREERGRKRRDNHFLNNFIPSQSLEKNPNKDA